MDIKILQQIDGAKKASGLTVIIDVFRAFTVEAYCMAMGAEKDTSVVMTKFDIGDGMQGMIGVVGPTRMDYAKITARLSYFAESLSKMFAKPEQAQLPEGKEDHA